MKARFIIMAITAVVSLTGFAATAEARSAEGMVTETSKLRAGPDKSFPAIGKVHPHVLVDVRGCTSNWNWCDVVVGHMRGWIRKDNLRIRYHGRSSQVIYAGPRLGLSIVVFDLEDYWDRHYYGRPFYVEYFRHHPHRRHHHRDHDQHHDHDNDRDYDRDHDWRHDSNSRYYHHD